MKAITLNFITRCYLFILAMLEWSEQKWKELTSPTISQLFAQAKRDMEEGKQLPELPELPPQMPVSKEKSHRGKFLFFYAWFSCCVWVFTAINISTLGFPEWPEVIHSALIQGVLMMWVIVNTVRLVFWCVTDTDTGC